VPMFCLLESEELEEAPKPSDKSTHFLFNPLDIKSVLSWASTSTCVKQALGCMNTDLTPVHFPRVLGFEYLSVNPEYSSV
jgi:hypothetical protein